MPHKKHDKAQPKADDQALIEKVDAMMDLKHVASTPKAEVTSAPEPAIDIFKDLKTAPPIELEAEVPAPEVSEPEPIVKVEESIIEVSVPEPAPEVVAPKPSMVDVKPGKLDDPATEQAVNEIIVAESDALLAAEDVASTVAAPVKQEKPKKGFSLRKLFK